MRQTLALLTAVLPLLAQAGDTLDYTVRPGDTLIGLSHTFLIEPAEWPRIARLNRLADANRLIPGQTLRLPLALLRKVDAPAELRAARGDVRVDGIAPTVPARLSTGARITTGAQGSAVLRLADGTEVRLPPRTEALLGEQSRYPVTDAFAQALRVIQGGVEVLAAKARRARPLEVTTPTAVIGVRGTHYRVAHEGASRTEVLEGRVAAAVPQAPEAAVDAGQGARLVPGEAPRPVPLAPAPDLSALPGLIERPLVRLDVPGGAALRAQVAADERFEQIVRDVRVAAGQPLRIEGLPDGQWHLRVRRIGVQQLEGLDGVHAFRLHARPEPPAILGPRGKASVGEVPLTWARNTEASGYRIEFARDAAFTQPLRRDEVADVAEARVALAEPGTVYWRMASRGSDAVAAGPWGPWGPWGEVQTLVLRAEPAAARGGLSADGRAFELSWDAEPDARQQVQLAGDNGFARPVASATVDGGRWAVPRPELPGTYYFRYRGIDPDGYVAPWSSTLAIEVQRDWSGLLWFLPVLLLGL